MAKQEIEASKKQSVALENVLSLRVALLEVLVQVHKLIPAGEKAHVCQCYTQLLVNQANIHMDNLTHMLKLPNIKAVHHNKCKRKNMNIAVTDTCTLQD